jgi:hypothetical protein
MYTHTLYTHNPAAGPIVGLRLALYTHWYTVNHRDSMVINTGSTHYLQDETTVNGSFEHGLRQFC